MPGNVPNISDNTFSFIKAYAKVVLQQGVPILDADWNELQDIIRVARIRQNIVMLGNCRLAPGSSNDTPGFVLKANGTSNNFYFTPGLACVEGVIVPSIHDESEPVSDVWYNSDDNFLMEGKVTSLGTGTIIDENTFYELFMDVVGCRIKMTSGADIGTTYIISSRVSSTELQLSSGTGSIAPGDTYKMLPPALTTPSGARVDEVYIQAWFEDINSEEDTDLYNATLGLEASHRSKVRSVVRVSEGGSTPSTPDPFGVGVRYMRIGRLNRTATAAIQSGHPQTESNAVHKAGLGSADTLGSDPQLIWRNLGWKADAEVTAYTISIYQWGPSLVLLRGAYLANDGHVYVGSQPTQPFWADTYGNVQWGLYGAAFEDLGSFADDATWYCRNEFSNEGPNFKGGTSVDISSKLSLVDGADLQLDNDGHIIGDVDSASGAMKLFAMNVGLEVQMLYTDDEFWWLLNTTYDRATEEFVSISPTTSYLMRFVSGGMKFMHHIYSSVPWEMADWSYFTAVDTSKVQVQDIRMAREMDTYAVDQERVFTRYPGFLCVRMEHPTQGRHVALFRTDDNDSIFSLVSGNSSYFDAQYGHSGTVNVYPSGAGGFLIQNKVTSQVDVGYGYIQMSDIS
jgi:hypothetical protein